jgi:hypothetical protein
MISTSIARCCATSSRFFSTQSKPAVIGFIGLGNMGFSMAKNLTNAPATLRSKVIVFDMDKSKSQALAKMGAEEVADIKSMAKQCDVIITMLPASKHVQGVMNGPDGIIANAKAGTLLIDSSTIDPLVSRSLHEAATAAKLRMIDAPVSGGVTGAAAGTLTFMVGGTTENLEASRVRSVSCLTFAVALRHGLFALRCCAGRSVGDGQEHSPLRRRRRRRYFLGPCFLPLLLRPLLIWLYRQLVTHLCADCCARFRRGEAVQQPLPGYLHDRHLRGYEPGARPAAECHLFPHLYAKHFLTSPILFCVYLISQGVQLGMDANKLAGVLNTSTGRCDTDVLKGLAALRIMAVSLNVCIILYGPVIFQVLEL